MSGFGIWLSQIWAYCYPQRTLSKSAYFLFFLILLLWFCICFLNWGVGFILCKLCLALVYGLHKYEHIVTHKAVCINMGLTICGYWKLAHLYSWPPGTIIPYQCPTKWIAYDGASLNLKCTLIKNCKGNLGMCVKDICAESSHDALLC